MRVSHSNSINPQLKVITWLLRAGLSRQSLESAANRPLLLADLISHLDSDDPVLLFALGFLLHRLGSNAEAQTALHRSVLVYPMFREARVLLARVYLDLGQPDKALEHAKAANVIALDEPDALCIMGSAMAALGKVDEALAKCNEAVKKDKTGHAYLYLGRVLESMDRKQEALDAYSEFIDRFPESPDARMASAELAFSLGHEVRAAGDLSVAVRHGRHDPEISRRAALFFLDRLGDPETALAYVDLLLERNHDDVRALEIKVRAAFGLGERGEARKALTDLKRLDPEAATRLEPIFQDRTRGRKVFPKGIPWIQSPDSPIYQIKLKLMETKPEIWRRLLIPADLPFDRLHHVFQAAMGWSDCHLHCFEVDEATYGNLNHIELDLDWVVLSETRLSLEKSRLKTGDRFTYVYDFGDNWVHEALIEDIFPRQQGQDYPSCIAGERNRPPEDVGGVGRFEEFLKIIGNRRHRERKAMLQWAGEDYDPAAFDIEEANKEIKRRLSAAYLRQHNS